MAKRKGLFGLFGKKKVSSKSTSSLFGLLFIGAGSITFLSFLRMFYENEYVGEYIGMLRKELFQKLGSFAYLVPILLFLLATLFFGKKKKKLVKSTIPIGTLLCFLAVLGVTRMGEWGTFMFTNLSLDFSSLGAFLILTVCFLIGLILLLDTSVDAFVMFVYKGLQVAIIFFKNHVFRELLSGSKSIKLDKKDVQNQEELKNQFIQNDRTKIAPGQMKINEAKISTGGSANQDMVMKPYAMGSSTWVYPPVSLLQDVTQQAADRGDVKERADTIEKTLESFGIRAKVDEVNHGPTVTQYALQITRGTKLSKITALGNDLALALAAPMGQVRIEAPIPGRSLVGIEIPNNRPEIVTLKRIFNEAVFKNSNDPLLVPLGLDVSGIVQAASISKMPHVLIAGTTGSGKSVMLNAWIATMLFRSKPEELRMIMIDPKRVELSAYNGIPHLLTEVIVEPAKIISALKWTVGEMEARYKEFARVGAKNIDSYNASEGVEKKPYIVFIIDELADLMMFAPGEAEDFITRIAQMARATGIHLVLATQRPSVDVITGLMKANIPTRLAFNVSSLVDSRVIIDTPGAEKLLGKGDMLFLPPDQAKPRRIQGPYLTEKEVHDLVGFLKSQAAPVHYTEEITSQDHSGTGSRSGTMGTNGASEDALFNQALEIIYQSDKASASMLQRKLSIGFTRAARLLDQMEAAGYVGPGTGSKPREILRRASMEEKTE